MKSFLAKLRVFKRFSAGFGPAPDHDPEWTQEDAHALALFMNGTTGRKLSLRVRYWEAARNAEAVMKPDNQPWRCGYAAGWRSAWAWFLTLYEDAQPSTKQGTDTEAGEGAAAYGELYAP